MSESKGTGHGGIGFLGLLTIVFIALKLCGVIHWAWWWVLGPVWIPVSVAFVVLALCAIVFAVRQ